ncbi:MAG: HAMP domain-containing protein [Deltaproteobacteria bacterium]|nr:MAG: HAMP domain-containing protein [Deltaproteobacteria bacterium]
MAMKTGLRTEIVISTVLLLGAALLFAGFLLVKLTERELLEERRASLQRTVRLIAAASPSSNALSTVLVPLTRDGELVAWRLYAADLVPVLSFSLESAPLPDDRPAASVPDGSLTETLTYSSLWNPFREPPPSWLDFTLAAGDPAGGVLQLRFSLASLVAQVHRSQRLVLAYVVLYGTVLSAFGIFVLNRNVVEPVRRLRSATAGVAAGDLAPIDMARGPGEISELAEDFNSMIAALQASRAETAAHIRSLEDANLALQQARDEVVRAEKMASVGHVAAGMAHEIGNPLSAVIGYLNLLRDELADPGQRDLAERSLLEAGRIDRLVRDLLDYASPARSTGEPLDPLAVLRDAVALLTNQGALDAVRIVDRAPERLGLVRMDYGRFQQVCVNLLLNARDAMPGGGEVVVTAERRDDMLVLTVADSGEGILGEHLGKIFEPFFTTKDPGKGRGLGLAVCQRLIVEAGGRIDVESEAGAGSRFHLRLPLASEGA